MNGAFVADRRGVTPAVGKALEVGVVVVFVGVLSASLYGGFVPSYRTATGDEVADRTVVAAAERIENAVPPVATEVRAVHRVDLPTSIRGESYRVVVRDRRLVLDHPDSGVHAETPLSLPERIAMVEGEWESTGDPVVVVEDGEAGLSVRLADSDTVGDAGDEEGDR